MSEKPTLIIGDVHGHFDRLDALLQQEGIINTHGVRINNDVTVVQVGDLGHFGSSPVLNAVGGFVRWEPTNPSGDMFCYEAAYVENWIDIVLWGNHDRAVYDSSHAFGGYKPPSRETKEYMVGLYEADRLLLAYACHDYLVTHAGLHASYKYQRAPEGTKTDPYIFADYINAKDQDKYPGDIQAVWNAISNRRGGGSSFGGILWRDQAEKLYRPFNQVYGHSASPKGKVRQIENSYNIDIGGKDEARLAGIWLPKREIVRVDL